MSSKVQYPRELIDKIWAELHPLLAPFCQTVYIGNDEEELGLKLCGSHRRGKQNCGDMDIVYVSKQGPACPAGELIPQENQILADLVIGNLIQTGVLDYRRNVRGVSTYGVWNKLMLHVATGVPIDFYRATPASYSNLVLCRTGSAEHNIILADAAIAKGWKWQPTAKFPGFQDGYVQIPIDNDRHAFELLGLDYKSPEER